MSKQREKYLVGKFDLFNVRNRNETRVAESLREILEQEPDLNVDEQAVSDIYAYALNQLPARYTQRGTIVLRDPVRKDVIRNAVKAAVDVVTKRPKK